jgi:hypothetical protein
MKMSSWLKKTKNDVEASSSLSMRRSHKPISPPPPAGRPPAAFCANYLWRPGRRITWRGQRASLRPTRRRQGGGRRGDEGRRPTWRRGSTLGVQGSRRSRLRRGSPPPTCLGGVQGRRGQGAFPGYVDVIALTGIVAEHLASLPPPPPLPPHAPLLATYQGQEVPPPPARSGHQPVTAALVGYHRRPRLRR